MTVGIGVDVVDLQRFESVVHRRPNFVGRVFTAAERAYCERGNGFAVQCQRYAARFAAKEAVMKALGCGLGAFAFHDVAVGRDDDTGEPTLFVAGNAATLAEERGVGRWHLSLSHSDTIAIAFVLAESR